MLLYDEEDVVQGDQNLANGKWNFKLSIQRFLQLDENYKISGLIKEDEKFYVYNEIIKEGSNIITYVNKVIDEAKNSCTCSGSSNGVKPHETSNEPSLDDEDDGEDDGSLIDTIEDLCASSNIYNDIFNEKGLYNSSEDESSSIHSLSVSSDDSIINDDNIVPCTDDGAPDFSTSPNYRNNKRRRISSNSSIETIVRPKKHYKLLDSDDDVDAFSEDKDTDSNEVEEEQEEKEKVTKKVGRSSDNIETVVISSDDEGESDTLLNNKNQNKYQRRILTNDELAQSTRETKKINEVLRKEYSQRLQNKEIIHYCTESNNLPYYERKIKSIILEENEENMVRVDEAFVKVLKPHQAEGIDFLYFTTIRSLKYIDDPGNGGILAHCMGLGKSLQVIVYLQTIFFNPIISKKISKGLLLVPTNVINNWERECDFWQSLIDEQAKKFGVYVLASDKFSYNIHSNYLSIIEKWVNSSRPSIIIVGYEMFRSLIYFDRVKRNRISYTKQKLLAEKYCEYLQMYPDIVICDEAHKLKNVNSKLALAVNGIATKRRICLTGTPIQNNLREYFTMINFVRPNLLGTYKEFSNQFVNPIEKGIKEGASSYDVRLMKRRYVVLWKVLDHVINRKDASFLYSTLPPKEEYIIYCSTTTLQIKLLKELLEVFSANSRLLQIKSIMSYICTHPSILKKICVEKFDTKLYDSQDDSDLDDINDKTRISDWLKNNNFLEDVVWNNFELSSKIIILFEILRYAEVVGDKVLVFVQYRETINYIEKSLKYFAENNLWYGENHSYCQKSTKRSWKLYKDYFIITGDTSLLERSFIESRINMRGEKSSRPRLVLMTTKASSVGTNFIGANRVVLFESGFNPSDDIQALHRVYRIGQRKPTFVYRLVSQGTIEERVQERQILKEGISRCSIDKHNIRDLYNDEDIRWNKLNCIDVSSPSFCRATLPKPNDDLLSSLIIKYPKKIINYAIYDSLLENKVDEGLTEEEKEKEWDDYIQEQKRIESGEFLSGLMNFSLNNLPPPVLFPRPMMPPPSTIPLPSTIPPPSRIPPQSTIPPPPIILPSLGRLVLHPGDNSKKLY